MHPWYLEQRVMGKHAPYSGSGLRDLGSDCPDSSSLHGTCLDPPVYEQRALEALTTSAFYKDKVRLLR